MSVKRITAAQAEVEYGGSEVKRITAAQAEVEYGGSEVKRITAAGAMVEYHRIPYMRITAAGVMVYLADPPSLYAHDRSVSGVWVDWGGNYPYFFNTRVQR